MNILPANLNLGNVKEKMTNLLGDAGDQFASYFVPGWVMAKNYLKRSFTNNYANKRLHAYKKGDYKSLKQTTKSAMETIKKEISGTWNPVTRLWNMVKFIFGVTKQERIEAAINNLIDITDDPYAFESADEIVEFAHKELMAKIKQSEGWLSKLGLWTNKKVLENPDVQALSKLVVSALHPFQEIFHKAVPGLKISNHDLNLIEKKADQLSRGSKSKYTADAGASYNRLLNDIRKQEQIDAARRLQAQQSHAAPAFA